LLEFENEIQARTPSLIRKEERGALGTQLGTEKRFDVAEMRLRKRFSSSRILNRHGGSAEQERLHGGDMQKQLRQDQSAGKKTLREAALALGGATTSSAGSELPSQKWFDFAGHSFSSIFGGPGVHGYGSLRETEHSSAQNEVEHLEVFVRATKNDETCSENLLCIAEKEEKDTTKHKGSYQGDTKRPASSICMPDWLASLQKQLGIKRHAIIMESLQEEKMLPDPGGLASLDLGRAFDLWESFTLEYDVKREKARFTSCNQQGHPQPSILKFLNKRKSDESALRDLKTKDFNLEAKKQCKNSDIIDLATDTEE